MHSNLSRLLILTLVHFMVDFCGGLNVPLPEPTLTRHLGVSLSAVALLLGGFGIAVNVLQPLSAWLLPVRGAPILLAIGPVAAAACACLGLTDSYGGTAALLLIAAFGIALVHPEGALAAHSLAGRRQSLGMSFFMSAGYFGYATGSLASGLWVEHRGLSGFWLLGLPAVLTAGLVLASGLHRLEGHMVEERDTKPGALPFWLVLLLAISVATNMGLFVRLLPLHMVRTFPAQSAQAWAGTAVFATGITGVIGAFLWAPVSDRLGRGLMLTILQVAAVPFLFMALRTTRPSLVPLWSAGVGLTMGGVFPLIVIMARHSRGLSKRMRMGLAIGGAWGMGELFFIAAGQYIGRVPGADPQPVSEALLACWTCLAITAMVGIAIALHERKHAGSVAAGS